MRHVLFILTIFLFVSCRTQKSLTKARTETTMTTKDSIHTVIEQTVKVNEFDDTLRTNSYVPFDFAQGPQSDRTVTAESKGIKVTAIVTPRRDSTGKIVGNDIHLEAVAKPVKTVEESRQETVSSKQETVSSQQSVVKSKETKKPLLGFPWWVWVIGVGVIIVVIIRFGKKYFKFFI